MKILHLNRLAIKRPSDLNQIDIKNYVIRKQDSRTLSEINGIVANNRDELMPMLKDGGAGFWAEQISEDLTGLQKLSMLFTGKIPDTKPLYTLLEVKPKSLLDALKVCRMFGWQTNLDYAEFAAVNDDGEICEYMVYSKDKLIEILEQLNNEKENA